MTAEPETENHGDRCHSHTSSTPSVTQTNPINSREYH